ncbi:hypothetical protein H5410_041283 [Solanum commersonii]|uniref:Uncharacterized protein n=1 Tax=Solanum commersonii TaxID=4109 RepID=A0A9J5XRE0_SOLCO|nr:hypothetical protein H5410_041283 [Solanum commersonii]
MAITLAPKMPGAEEMKAVMGKLVDEQQMTFLKGRPIMDVGETEDTWNLVQLDIEILEDMGYSTLWISWIRFYISNVKSSLVINGNTKGFFNHQGS